MKDKTKKIISNIVTSVVGIYGLLWLLTYFIPVLYKACVPALNEMGQHFLLIPFAAAGGLLMVLTPLALLILVLILVEAAMYKLLGLKLDW